MRSMRASVKLLHIYILAHFEVNFYAEKNLVLLIPLATRTLWRQGFNERLSVQKMQHDLWRIMSKLQNECQHRMDLIDRREDGDTLKCSKCMMYAPFAVESKNNQITEKLLTVMEDLGVSKTELANRLGVNRARVTQMFKSDTNWSISTILKVADVLDCEIQICPRVSSTFGGQGEAAYSPAASPQTFDRAKLSRECVEFNCQDCLYRALNGNKCECDCHAEQPLESAVADDFNSSAASKDGSFLERFG
jgi:transcriptional regulator with XRE-family HTH domain